MNKFIFIKDTYYNINSIDKIQFEDISYGYETIYHIIINDNIKKVTKEYYEKIKKLFLEIVGEENIYE